MNGAGNEFYVVDARDEPIDDASDLARVLCASDRFEHADGLLVILPSDVNHVRMRMFNPDGSEAEMCGNGIRCIARYVSESDGIDAFTVETLAGPIHATVTAKEPTYEVCVAMGQPQFGASRSMTVGETTYRYDSVDMGNPHVVIFTDDVAGIDLVRVGPAIATDPSFPHGTNVHFVEALMDGGIKVRHWERGAGATAACGTGAVASAAAAIRSERATSPIAVHVPGGVLIVEWTPGQTAYMTGDAVREYERVLDT